MKKHFAKDKRLKSGKIIEATLMAKWEIIINLMKFQRLKKRKIKKILKKIIERLSQKCS